MSERPASPDKGKLASYAIGSLGTGVFSTVPTALLLYYCTELLHLPASIAGALMFLPKAWAIAWDPIVGAWSDRFRSRWGRRQPFLVIGAFGIAVSFVILFSAPAGLGLNGLAIWVGVAYFFLATIYSVYAVPYIALPAEIATGQRERTAFVSWRMVAGMAGVFLGAAGAPLLVAALGGGRAGYASMSWIVAGICLAAMLGAVMAAPKQSIKPDMAKPTSALKSARAALAAPGFGHLMTSYYLQITAVGVVTSSMPYLVTRSIGRPESDIGLALAALIGAAVLTPPLWAWAAQKYGQRAALVVAMIVFGFATIGAGATVWLQASWSTALAVMSIAGVGFAGLQVIPFSILADLAHRESAADSNSREATFTGLWTATEKLGLATGPALVAAGLTFAGPGASPYLIAIAPIILLSGAAIFLFAARMSPVAAN